jgi:hypothetical protein
MARDECDMNLTNESYVILISTKTSSEFYYKDKSGWLKVSARVAEPSGRLPSKS